MFKKNTHMNPGLKEAIELALAELKQHDPDTEEYATILTQIERLFALDAPDKRDKVSKDGLVAVGGNLLGIGMILSWEQVHVITSKALGFVPKIRI